MVYEKDLDPIVSQDVPEGDTPETPEAPAIVSQEEDTPEEETPETPEEGGAEDEGSTEE